MRIRSEAGSYGTFLGAVRTGEFIPHDDDLDLAVVLQSAVGSDPREELIAIMHQLTAMGVKVTIMEDYDFIKVWSPTHGRFADLFSIVPKDEDTVRMYMEGLTIRDVPRRLVLPFTTMTFYGEVFNVPASAEDFLADRYGADWRVPKRAIGTRNLEV